MARTHPTQLLSDVAAELRGVNERLDTLIGRSAPQVTPVPAGPSVEPAPVRLEEPVRPTLEQSLSRVKDAAVEAAQVIDIPIAEPVDAGAMPKAVEAKLQTGERALSRDETNRERAEEEVTCQEQTKRGNVCGKPLPCRYHG